MFSNISTLCTEWPLAPGVVVKDGAVPGGGIDVCVDLGCEDALVTEHFLYYSEVGAVFYEVGGKAVAEGVGGDFLVHTGGHGLVFYHIKYGYAAEGLAKAVEEKVVLKSGGGRRRA